MTTPNISDGIKSYLKTYLIIESPSSILSSMILAKSDQYPLRVKRPRTLESSIDGRRPCLSPWKMRPGCSYLISRTVEVTE
jgi:hypothetical protein